MADYITRAELQTYATARGVTIADSDADVAIVKAKDWLDVQPITFDTDPDVPDAIKTAQSVAAMLINDGFDLFESSADRVVSMSLDGALSETYKDSERYFTQLEALIAPYRDIGTPGGTGFNTVRG